MRIDRSGLVRTSLEAGGTLSRAVLTSEHLAEGTLRVPGLSPGGSEPQDLVRGIGDPTTINPERSAEELLSDLRDATAQAEAASLFIVVEDDLRRPDDPAVVARRDSIFAGDAVLYARSLDSFQDGHDLGVFLNQSSSGYPLNAFAIGPVTYQDLRDLLRTNVAKLGGRVNGIINSVFDGEGFSLWAPARGADVAAREVCD